MEPSRQVVTLSRIGNGRYVATDRGSRLELRLSAWRSRGEALVDTRRYQLQRTGILDRGVAVLGPDGAELIRLSRKHPNVPGLPGCEWRVRARWRGYEARLTGPAGVEVLVRGGHGDRGTITAEITGSLPDRGLTVLAAAFAVVLRRREDSAAAVAAATAAVASG
jgi:hypothetical protein